jgi:hypothetical protein
MAIRKKRVHVQEYCEDVYIVKKLVNTVDPPLETELRKRDVQQLISEGVEVTVTRK